MVRLLSSGPRLFPQSGQSLSCLFSGRPPRDFLSGTFAPQLLHVAMIVWGFRRPVRPTEPSDALIQKVSRLVTSTIAGLSAVKTGYGKRGTGWGKGIVSRPELRWIVGVVGGSGVPPSEGVTLHPVGNRALRCSTGDVKRVASAQRGATWTGRGGLPTAYAHGYVPRVPSGPRYRGCSTTGWGFRGERRSPLPRQPRTQR